MTSQHKPENTTKTNEAPPSLGKALHVKGSKEAVEDLLESLAEGNLSITQHVKSLHTTRRGSYFVSVKQNNEYNEITVKLYENTHGQAIATGYIDRGHTKEDRRFACEELRGLIRAYLCR